MANLAYRRESVARLLGSVLAPGASYTVTAYAPGARVNGNQTTATPTVDTNNGFTSGVGTVDCIVVRSGSMVPGSFVTCAYLSATSVTLGSSLTLLDGDLIVNLGADTGSSVPNYDGSTFAIYSDTSSADTIQYSRVTANSQGEYEYWWAGGEPWELVRASDGTVVDILPGVPSAINGPASSVDNAIVRWDGTLGRALKGYTSSAPTISDTGGVQFSGRPWFDVTHPTYGADPTGTSDSTAAIQAAIDAAASQESQSGSTAKKGGVVFLPVGRYRLDSPIVLPRAEQSTHPRSVWLIGASKHSTVLVGSGSGWSSGDACIEWAATAFRSWDNRIANMTIIAPDVVGTHAVYFAPTLTSTWAQINAERFNLVMENVELEGSNQYHSALVRIAGMATHCRFINVWGDPTTGTRAYDTMLFHFDETPLATSGENNIGDDSGCTWGTFQNIWVTPQRGGYCGFFKGRISHSFVGVVEVGVGNYSDPVLDVNNSVGTVFANLMTEGRGEQPQIKLTDSRYLTFHNLYLGHPNDEGGGVGNGIEFIGCTDCKIDGRVGDDSNMVAFKDNSVKMVTLDANSSRNYLRMAARVATSQSITDEYTDSGTDNLIELIDHTNSREYYSGGPRAGEYTVRGDRNETWKLRSISESITLSTSGLTTDSSANLLPANSIIEAVVARVTTTITTTTNWALGDATTAARFAAANSTLVSGTTSVGLAHQQGGISTDATGPVQTAAAKLRITCTGSNPGAGVIRVTVFYRQFVAPTVS